MNTLLNYNSFPFCVVNTETFDFIVGCISFEFAQTTIKLYEIEDKKDGTYTPDFYSILEAKN